MCLTNLQRGFGGLFKKKKEITVYKILRLNHEIKKLVSYNGHLWKRGNNNFLDSTRLTKWQINRLYKEAISTDKNKQLNYGFHVYTDKDEAIVIKNNSYNSDSIVIVEFKANRYDCLGVGLNNKDTKGAVFTDLFLSSQEYNKHINAKKKVILK